MPIHLDVLDAARRLSERSADFAFRVRDVVRALPHRDEGAVRTHVSSRCCVNAPGHHATRWPYFRRVSHGVYVLEPAFRPATRARTSRRVAEPSPAYAGELETPLRHEIHAVIHRERGVYTAECLEVAVVTQGRTLDETVANLREAVSLHLEGEDPREWGLVTFPGLTITWSLPGPAHGRRA